MRSTGAYRAPTLEENVLGRNISSGRPMLRPTGQPAV
jgi:hypothetical protein